MKIFLKIIIILIPFTVSSQNKAELTGNVIYKQKYIKASNKSNKKQSFKSFETKISKEINRISYNLSFNRTQYIFKQDEEMKVDDKKGNRLALILGGGNGVFYGDLKKNIKLHKRDAFGEAFIIKSNFKDQKWDIKNETKIIGGYTCQRAIIYEDIYSRKGKSKRLVTAWFTKDVPIPFGPAGYGNLPGLIIELYRGSKYVFYCNEVSYNGTVIEIAPPRKGKILSESEFNQISKEMFDNRKRGG